MPKTRRRKNKTNRLSGATAGDMRGALAEAKSVCSSQYSGDPRAIESCIEGAQDAKATVEWGFERIKEKGIHPDALLNHIFEYSRARCPIRRKIDLLHDKPCAFGVDTFERKLKAKRPNLAGRRSSKR